MVSVALGLSLFTKGLLAKLLTPDVVSQRARRSLFCLISS